MNNQIEKDLLELAYFREHLEKENHSKMLQKIKQEITNESKRVKKLSYFAFKDRRKTKKCIGEKKRIQKALIDIQSMPDEFFDILKNNIEDFINEHDVVVNERWDNNRTGWYQDIIHIHYDTKDFIYQYIANLNYPSSTLTNQVVSLDKIKKYLLKSAQFEYNNRIKKRNNEKIIEENLKDIEFTRDGIEEFLNE